MTDCKLSTHMNHKHTEKSIIISSDELDVLLEVDHLDILYGDFNLHPQNGVYLGITIKTG